MKSSIVKFGLLLLVAALTGCAGTNFVRVPNEQMALGQTTYEQITARMGAPFQEGFVTKNGQQVKTASYAYASAGGEPAAEGVMAARSQGFYFFQGKLVGYEYTSSWKEDSTNFDSATVSRIVKGKSTRADVIRLLGEPKGKYIYPVIPGKSANAINYLYHQTKGTAFNLQFFRKQLIVTFNERDVVTNVEFTESGTR